MTTGNQAALQELEAAIHFFYDRVQNNQMNHFELLGIPTTATHKEIEAAYNKFSLEFSIDRIAMIIDPEVRRKGDFLFQRGKKAYDTLTDFKKRGEYEKRGFRELSVEDEPEDDVEERAKIIYKKAKSFKTMKQYEKAVKVMEEAIKLDANKPAYYLMLGMCQSQLPQYKRDAEANLQKAAQMEEWNAEPFAALGMLFYSERLFKRAEGYFRKALELEPSHALAKEKLELIVGPEVKPMEAVQGKLKKIFPSLFGKKK